MTDKIIVHGIEYLIKRTERSSLGITVERDGTVTINAPLRADLKAIERLVSSKTIWIRQKLAYKSQTNRERVRRDFVSGQGFLYLGKSYRLRLINNGTGVVDQKGVSTSLRLHNGYFELLEREKERGKDHFIKWYRKQTEQQLQLRIPRYANRIGVEVRDFRVLDLGNRWASCGKKGTLNFSWRTVMAPIQVFDYILVHEMAHMIERGHTKNFWRIVSRVISDYEDQKTWLQVHGVELGI
jgi:predicted metal-dependent hydrolase